MLMSDQSTTGSTESGRAQMLQMQLKAALRDAEEAEKAAELPTIEEAREQLGGRLAPLMAERRRALDAQLAEVRAAAQMRVEQARTEAEQIVAEAERVAAEEVARVEAERVAAEERNLPFVGAVAARALIDGAAFDAEVDPVVEVEPVVEAVPAAVESAPVAAPESEPVTVVAEAAVRAPAPEPVLDVADDIWQQVPVAAPQREAALPVAVTPVPAQVVVDAEAFARVFATVLAEVLSQRGFTQAPQPVAYPDAYRPAPQRQSFWSQARHLDVLLLGVSALIVVVVLAAWIV